MTQTEGNPIPIGARVKWRPDYNKSDWVGVVTAHVSDRAVQCDGRGGIDNSLLELADTPPVDPMAELIAQQCELIAELQDQADRAGVLENHLAEGVARLEAYLSETCGMSRPVRIDSPELRTLAELLFEGV